MSSASSASAPRRWSQNTGPASHQAPASSSRSSANRRPSSPHSGCMPPVRKSMGLLYLPLQPRGHCWSCWRGAHVWEPLVNQLILNGKHLTALLWWKASDQRASGADKQGSALHEPAGGCEGSIWKQRDFFSFFPFTCLTVAVSLCRRAVWSLMSLLRPQSALHLCASRDCCISARIQYRKTAQAAFKINTFNLCALCKRIWHVVVKGALHWSFTVKSF